LGILPKERMAEVSPWRDSYRPGYCGREASQEEGGQEEVGQEEVG